MDPQTQILSEFNRAEEARNKGNEGMARVCARRAAGIAIRDYFTRLGTPSPSTSAYDLLNRLHDDPRLPLELKLAVDHLTVRVTEDFKLPIDADLITEARLLCNWLLNNKS
jgi:hypothetical protein